MRKCPVDHDDPNGIPKFLCRVCNPKLNTSREEWLENLRKMPMAQKSDFVKMQEKLTELNGLRSQRGIDPIKHWRASYEGLLEAIVECKKKIKENEAVHSGKSRADLEAKSAAIRAKKEAAPKNLAKAAKAAREAKAKAGKAPAVTPKAPAPPPVPAKPGTAEAFNQQLKNREGTNQAKLATFLFENIGKKIANDKLAVAVYGKEAKSKGAAIGNVITGFIGKVKSIKGYSVTKTDDDVTLKKA